MNIVMEFAFRSDPRADNTNKWAIRSHDVPRHDAVGQDWVLFQVANLVERHLLSRPQISDDISDALFLVSFYKNRSVVGFCQLPRNLVLILGPPGASSAPSRGRVEGWPNESSLLCALSRVESSSIPRIAVWTLTDCATARRSLNGANLGRLDGEDADADASLLC
jgi:hypothetical protein